MLETHSPSPTGSHQQNSVKEPLPLNEVHPNPESPFGSLDEVIIVANRKIEPQKAGGLVQAMLAFANKAENVQVTSIGWDGKVTPEREPEAKVPQETFERMKPNGPINVVEIQLSENEVHAHYEDISNNGLWLAFHGKPHLTDGEFSFTNWDISKNVQKRFAKETATYRDTHPERTTAIWNHDYHMTMVAKYMRDEGITDPLGFFLHIPFPAPEKLAALPETARVEILDGLLANDMLGFQTSKDAYNFMLNIQTNLDLPQDAITLSENGGEIHWQGRRINIGTYPIGIDPEAVSEKVALPESQTKVEKLQRIFQDKTLLIDVSRLDPTKGIIEELDAYDRFLTKHPELRDDIVFLRIVSPSRENVPAYAQLKKEAREKVDDINQKWKHHGKKVMYFYQDVKNETVLAMIHASNVALVGTEIDGMNLVAKEAVKAGPSNMVVVVGEGAGASSEMKDDALIVDVSDLETFAETIHQAVTMPDKERIQRKSLLERQVDTHTVEKWSTLFIRDLLARTADDQPTA